MIEMLVQNLVLYTSIISINGSLHSPASPYWCRNKLGTPSSRRAHLESSRRCKSKEEFPFTGSRTAGSVVSFRSVEQPKTVVLRIRLRQSAYGPRVSLLTISFNPRSPGCPDRIDKSKEDAPESRIDRLDWLQRLRPTSHRRAELVESQD